METKVNKNVNVKVKAQKVQNQRNDKLKERKVNYKRVTLR